MNYSTFSARLPIEKQIPIYNNFLTQYSLLISSNLIVNELISKASEQDILDLFDALHGHNDEYIHMRNFHLAAMLNFNIPQVNEARGLWLDNLYVDMMNKKTTPKDMVLCFQRIKEFQLLYAIFENVVKQELFRTNLLEEGTFLREIDVIKKVNEYLSSLNKVDIFAELLSKRTCFDSIQDIDSMWKIFTHLRNLFAHSGGIVSQNWLDNYKSKIGLYENIMLKVPIQYEIENTIGLELFEVGKLYYLTDDMLNFFRNFIVYVMECLYLSIVSDEI